MSDGWDYIVNRYHIVNREAYYVTEIPFEKDDDVEVIIETPEEADEIWEEIDGKWVLTGH